MIGDPASASGDESEPEEEKLTAVEAENEAAFLEEVGAVGDKPSDDKPEQEAAADKPVEDDKPAEPSTVGDEGGSEITSEDAKPDSDKAKPEADKKDPDPFEALNARFDELDTKIGGIDQTAKTAMGRANSLHKVINAAQRTASDQGVDSPTPAQVEEASKDAEKWKELKVSFPEWGDGFDEHFKFEISKIEAKIPKVDGLVSREEAQAMVDAAEVRTEANVTLNIRHKGWKNTIRSEEFKAFRAANPEVDALGKSSNVADALSMLDQFKEHQEKQVQENKAGDDVDTQETENERRLAENLQVVKPKAAATRKGETYQSAFDAELAKGR